MDIFLTLDYELALGADPGTVNNNLICPMTDLMLLLSKTKTKVTVMVDGAYIYRMFQLKEQHAELEKDYNMVISNIKSIYNNGHSVQYHFHPQWMYSKYEDKKGWIMDFEHYKLSDVPFEYLQECFSEGLNIIEKETGGKICCFRAGGFSLCSSDYYYPLFINNGIKLDSSVKVGDKVFSKFQYYDYRKAPRKSIYHFKRDVTVEEKKNTDTIIEMPISTSRTMTSLEYLWKKYSLSRKLHPTMFYGDGVGVGTQLTKGERIIGLLKKLFGTKRIVASIDGFLSLTMQEIVKDCKARGQEHVVFLGHPKMATDASYKNLGCFIEEMIKEGNTFKTLDMMVTK